MVLCKLVLAPSQAVASFHKTNANYLIYMDNVGAGLPRDRDSTANIASRGEPAPTVPSSLCDSAARRAGRSPTGIEPGIYVAALHGPRGSWR